MQSLASVRLASRILCSLNCQDSQLLMSELEGVGQILKAMDGQEPDPARCERLELLSAVVEELHSRLRIGGRLEGVEVYRSLLRHLAAPEPGRLAMPVLFAVQ